LRSFEALQREGRRAILAGVARGEKSPFSSRPTFLTTRPDERSVRAQREPANLAKKRTYHPSLSLRAKGVIFSAAVCNVRVRASIWVLRATPSMTRRGIRAMVVWMSRRRRRFIFAVGFPEGRDRAP
jgi:hypothetical protein